VLGVIAARVAAAAGVLEAHRLHHPVACSDGTTVRRGQRKRWKRTLLAMLRRL
jgi:hypothetical protein